MKVIIIVLFSYSFVFGQFTESHKDAARQMLLEINLEKTLNQSIDILLSSFSRSNPAIAKHEDILRAFFSKNFTYELLEDDYIQIYCNEFTEDELRELTEFYKTDIGQKLLVKLPILMKKGAELGENRVKEFLPELLDSVKQKLKEESIESETNY